MNAFRPRPAGLLFSLVCASAWGQEGIQESTFPLRGALPKVETGALRFLAQHPEYDGRGVTVAIFDTGVDPGAEGLQFTTDGKPKIVDIVDASGSGDVPARTVVEAQDGKIAGLSGRQLSVGAGWTNPTGKYHIGLKPAYELFPGGLVARLKQKRREKWDEQQRVLETNLEREIAGWEQAHADPTAEQKKELSDLQARLEQLRALQKDYDDPGPVHDCVVFHDGSVWRVAIDTDEDGELAEEKLLTSYRIEHEYGTFGSEDLMNYAVNVYDDGNLLSIVADAGAHGTHVAGIVAAHYPDRPELNGVAPGAQLVAVKIGDTRVGSSSMGTGEVRGLVATLQNKCDLINMSYGGPTADPNSGRLPGLYSEIVNRHNVIFVSSAGNEGPALSSVGSPGGTTEALFGIGAYVSPEMMSIQYSMRQALPEMQYTWSSRGPTYDGALGVKFSAPGGAIAPVPNWVLQRNMQMNGTSMAAPNACGGIALLLSGLKKEGVAYSPARIRRAIENTARGVEGIEVFAQGPGLIQVDKAFDYLLEYRDFADQDLRFEVSVPSRADARGIYLREPFETGVVFEGDVHVDAKFHEDAENRPKVEFELDLELKSTQRWVAAPGHLVLMHGGRSFNVRIDPTRLEPGVHYAEIQGFDAGSPGRGPVFRLPITVIRTETVDGTADFTWRKSLRFRPGQLVRSFLVVPEGATWADLTIRAQELDASRRLVLHAAQLVPGKAFADTSYKQRIWMESGDQQVRSFPVVGGRALELCLGQYWSTMGESGFDFELAFHGIRPGDPDLALRGGGLVAAVDVTAPFRREEIAPSGSLTKLRRMIRPKSGEVVPLSGERDRLPEARQIYGLTLEYAFSLDDDAKVWPVPAINENLEFSETWESLIWMIFNSTKRLLAAGGPEPDPVSLKKGDYTLRFFIRSDDLERLKKLKSMVLLLDRQLDKPISLDFYADPDDALESGRKFGSRTLQAGESVEVNVATPAASAVPDFAEPGDALIGSLTYGRSNGELAGAGKRPGGYAVTMLVAPAPAKEKGESGDAEADPQEEEKDVAARLAEQVRDAKVDLLRALRTKKKWAEFDRLAEQMLTEHPDYLPLLVERLKRLDGEDRDEHLLAVVEAADAVIAQIDQAQLARELGVNVDPDDPQAKKQRKEADEKKATLADALYRKGRALAFMSDQLDEQKAGPADPQAATATKFGAYADPAALAEAFEATYDQLQKWVDMNDSQFVRLYIRRERRQGRPGVALELLNKELKKAKPEKLLYEKRIDLLDELGWSNWRDYEKKWMLIRYPSEYPPF